LIFGVFSENIRKIKKCLRQKQKIFIKRIFFVKNIVSENLMVFEKNGKEIF